MHFSHIVFFAQSVSRGFDKSLPCYTPVLVVVFSYVLINIHSTLKTSMNGNISI